MKDEYLSLGLGKLETDWSKNFLRQDWSCLFSSKDKAEINYYNYNDEGKPIIQRGWGYKKALQAVRTRLDLLGYSFNKLPRLLQDYFESFPYVDQKLLAINCDEFIRLLSEIDVNSIDWVEHEGDADPGEFFTRRILNLPAFKPISELIKPALMFNEMVFEQIETKIIIAALAHNPANQGLDLEWRDERPSLTPLDPYETYLIVTEGKSDGDIIKKALELLYPSLADFFEFIDMTDGYPFPGAGNLFKFVKGLIKIGTNRKMLIIFDNDTEGQFQLGRLLGVSCPQNIKMFALPDMPEFIHFPTIGPSGESFMDVNGKAVAIEMFLDHTYNSAPPPRIRWSNFQTSMDQYQGALESKELYSTSFLSPKIVQGSNYNFSMLYKLIDSLLETLSK